MAWGFFTDDYTATASNPGMKYNPPVFSLLTTATKPALERGSRRGAVRLAKTHHRIGGASLALGHLHVSDYGKDERRNRRDRNNSEPLHRGTLLLQDWIDWKIRQMAHKQQLGRNKDGAAAILLPPHETSGELPPA
jgi:hypothetical protein